MSDVCAMGLIGVLYIFLGIWSMLRKRLVLEFGRWGTFNPNPMVIFTLTEGRALLFGYVSLGVGLAILGTGVYIYLPGNELLVRQGLSVIVVVLGTSIAILTFLFELVMEFLVALKNSSRK